MTEPKTLHRLPPCPDYDAQATESWLEALAAKGLFLTSDGFFLGFGAFSQGAPARVRYRLLPLPKSPSIFDEGGPDPGQTDLMAQFGWEYIAMRGNFLIYRADDLNAPEPDSDPQIQALNLKSVVKKSRSELLSSVFSILFILFVSMFGKLTSFLMMMGPGWAGMLVVFVAWNIFRKIRVWRHLSALRKKLEAGQTLSHQTNFEAGRIPHRIGQSIDLVLTCGLFTLLALLIFASPLGGEKDVPLEESPVLPFATLEEIFPEAQIVTDGHLESTLTHWENSISQNYELHQYATVRLPGGTSASASLWVRCHVTPFPALARALVWEAPSFGGFRNRRNMLDIHPEGTDYSLSWSDYRPKTAFCKGGTMMEVSLILYTDDDSVLMTPEDFAQLMADSLKGG